jgi:tetratricopeptide (TPR) repeat protein
MSFGFGFNKAKVLASAEKFVRQGNLQNAIAEYEKIVKEDPKDLTVLNTLGDLCARRRETTMPLRYPRSPETVPRQVEHLERVSPAGAEMEAVVIRDQKTAPARGEETESGGSPPCYASAEKIQEAEFYISQEMWDAAKKAILELTEIAPDAPEVTELIAAASAGQSRAARPKAVPIPPTSHPVKPKPEPPPDVIVASADFVPRTKPDPAPKGGTVDIPRPAPLRTEPQEFATVPAPSRKASGAASVNGDMRDAESASVLNDILSELQEKTADASEPEVNPETHSTRSIAFKEMGLLDEAIGELQKVCHALDGGRSFSQPVQAYTWLAQCLVDKGAPEAAVRWYKQALRLPCLDDGSRCAIYYDLAMAYEASGDKKSALTNFMEVYGSNIDFPDVASRIKALKS